MLPHTQPGSLLLGRAVGGRAAAINRRQKEVQVALWCSQEMRNSCHVGEKTYLYHVYGGFSPKVDSITRNE